MADFNYSLLKEMSAITPTSGSASLFINTAATASYVRSIILHNVSTSSQNVTLWKVSSGSVSPMVDSRKFFNYALSSSATFMLEFGTPGMMFTQSGDGIYGNTSLTGVNITIVGGTE